MISYSDNFSVSTRYAAPAWSTAAGEIVIEARWIDPSTQIISGTQTWFPDTFIFAQDGTVKVFDANQFDTANNGKIIDRAPANVPLDIEPVPEESPKF